MKKILLAAVAAYSLIAPAQAAIVFTENFDGYAPGVPWTNSAPWTATNVDLIANGTFNLNCAGNAGQCVDLSGSQPGSIARTVALAAGVYQLTFEYTGNQLDAFGGPWPQAGFTASIGGLNAFVGPLANNNKTFAKFTGQFTVTSAGNQTLTFAQQGGNNFRGSILDNVMIAAVPEPSTWLMLLAGFGLVGGAMRRRKPQTQLSFS
jgi:PEP-CTERM motif